MNPVIYFLVRSLFIGIGLSNFISLSDATFYITGFIGLLIGIIIIYLYEGSNHFIRKLSSIFISITLSTITINLSHTLYLDNTPILWLSIYTIGICFIISLSSKKVLNRTSYYLIYPSIGLLILELILLIPSFSFDNFYTPKLDHINTIKGSLYFTLISISPVLTLNYEKDKKKLILTYIISSLSIIIISIIMVGTLGYKETLLYRYPEYIILKRIHFSNFFTNVDNIFFFTILTDLTISLSCFIKEFSSNIKKRLVYTCLLILLTNLICLKSSWLCLLFNYLYIPLLILLILGILSKKVKLTKRVRIIW